MPEFVRSKNYRKLPRWTQGFRTGCDGFEDETTAMVMKITNGNSRGKCAMSTTFELWRLRGVTRMINQDWVEEDDMLMFFRPQFTGGTPEKLQC